MKNPCFVIIGNNMNELTINITICEQKYYSKDDNWGG